MPKRERTIALVATVALGLFLLAALLSYQRQAQLAQAMGEMVTVWQAGRPIAAYAPITRDALKAVQVPRRYLLPGLIAAEEDLTNWVSMVSVPANTLLTTPHLVRPDATEPGLVKVTLTRGLHLESGLLPGDLVMVVASYRESDTDVSRIFLPEARIAAVETKGREPTVSLLVPLARVEELIRIHDYGKAIHLTRRPANGG